ncbi:MAG: hypothetical protein Q4C03_04260 [bacterium]|nr:hypothetical protein [bacterium]
MRLIDEKAMMREYQEKLCLNVCCADCTMTDKADGACLIERWIYAQPTIDVVSLEQYRSMERTCYKLQKALYEMRLKGADDETD